MGSGCFQSGEELELDYFGGEIPPLIDDGGSGVDTPFLNAVQVENGLIQMEIMGQLPPIPSTVIVDDTNERLLAEVAKLKQELADRDCKISLL